MPCREAGFPGGGTEVCAPELAGLPELCPRGAGSAASSGRSPGKTKDQNANSATRSGTPGRQINDFQPSADPPEGFSIPNPPIGISFRCHSFNLSAVLAQAEDHPNRPVMESFTERVRCRTKA